MSDIKRYCVFCSEICDDLSNRITQLQARALSKVFTFDYNEGSQGSNPTVGLEIQYLHSLPCHTCQEWVSEAESVVEEWELILDKVRVVASHLKQLIQKAKVNEYGALDSGSGSCADLTRATVSKRRKFELSQDDGLPKLEEPLSPPAQVISPDVCDVELKLETEEVKVREDSDSDWVPEYAEDRSLGKQKITRNENRNLPSRLTRGKHKKCEAAQTYVQDTPDGVLRLKHCRIEITRCDDPSFNSRVTRNSSKLSRYRSLMKRLRMKSQKRKVNTKVYKKVGRPANAKYEVISGELQSCAAPYCYFKSSDPDQLAGHYRLKHLGDDYPYKCTQPNCEKVFKEFRRLSYHRLVHRGQFPISCPHCSKGFVRPHLLRAHVIQNHTENPTLHPCEHCGRSFRLQVNLRMHIKYFHTTDKYSCTIEGCKYVSKSTSSLRSHQGRIHPEAFPQFRPEEPRMCAACGATFSSKFLFRRHSLVHSGVPIEILKPHACSYEGCNYRAVARKIIKRHEMNVHEIKERNVKCDYPNCTAMFKTERTMQCHVQRIHTPKTGDSTTQSVICDQCSLELSSERALKNHIAVKHMSGNRNDFICDQCQRGYPTKKYLQRHKLKYPNCKPLQRGPSAMFCEPCQKWCSNPAGLKRHNHLVHNSELRPWKCERCGKSYPIKMYLLRHQRDSKTCLALPAAPAQAQHNMVPMSKIPGAGNPTSKPRYAKNRSTVVSSTDGAKKPEGTPDGQPVVKVGPTRFIKPKNIVPVQEPENGADAGDKCTDQQIQIPEIPNPASQIQRDFYYAFYGLQYQLPN